MVRAVDRPSGKRGYRSRAEFAKKLSLGRLAGLMLVVLLSWPIGSFSRPLPATDSSQYKNVLVLYPFSDTQLFASFDGLKSAVRARASVPVNFFVEYMETQRLEDPGYEASLSQALQHVYGAQHIDVVIASTFSALRFAIAHRDHLFPGVPIVFNYLSDRRLPNRGSWPGVTGVTMTIDVHGSVDLIFRLQPDTQRLAIITGTTEFERFWLRALHDELSLRGEKITVIDLVGLSPSETMQRVSQLPSHTAVFFQITPKMSAQPALGTYDMMAEIGSRIPTYCMFPSYCVNRGGIGGSFPIFDEQNAKTAELVARIFAGEKPESIAVVHDSGARPAVDARQLAHWKISESRLPAGSVVLFRPSTVWQDHKGLVLGALAVIVLQLLLISGLLYEHARKRRTLAALTESEERFHVMADSAPTLIWLADSEGEVTYFNQPALEFTGAKLEDLRNDGWQRYVHPDDLAGVLKANSAALRRREVFSKEYRLRHRHWGYRWVFDIGAPRLGKDRSFLGFIGSVIDVSDQKSAIEALEKLGGRLIDAQEKERSLIARELHDDICQRLAMLAFKIQHTMDNQDLTFSLQREAMKEVWEQCATLAGDVQALSHDLHSSILDHLGLKAAAENFCQEFSKNHKVAVAFSERDVPNSLPRDISLSLFRILQESLRNAVKHSGVDQFSVYLEGALDEITLEIRDQGIGFDVQEAKSRGGIGLLSMTERVNLLRGDLRIASSSGKGTKIRVVLPLATDSTTAQQEAIAR